MRGRRPGELTELQARQRKETRQKLIEAANTVFARESYISSSIDDIAQRANVSRNTFYKHFNSKLEVATAILKHYSETLIDDYGRLATKSNPNIDDITSWIESIIQLWRKLRTSMTTLSTLLRQDPALIAGRYEANELLIERLGENIPAFGVAAKGQDEEARVQAHLLLIELEEMCHGVVISKWIKDEDAAIRIVAKHYHEFIAAYASKQRAPRKASGERAT